MTIAKPSKKLSFRLNIKPFLEFYTANSGKIHSKVSGTGEDIRFHTGGQVPLKVRDPLKDFGSSN